MNRLQLSLAALLGALMPLVFDSALKGAALLAAAALGALVLCKASAATRHLVWLVAVVALLIVPVLSFALPQWRILPQWTASPLADATVRPATIIWNSLHESYKAHEAPSVTPSAVLPRTDSPAPSPSAAVPLTASSPAFLPPSALPEPVRTWRDWLPLAWAAGFTFLALRLFAAHLLLWRTARSCTTLTAPPDGFIAATFTDACTQLGIHQRVTLLLDPKRTIPVVWGVFRPRLVLPAEAREWNEDQLRSVLLHELAHIKRRDALVQWITQIACALHWFNPLVWLAAWRLHTERERACDDLVLASGVRPSAYAEHLLHVATKLSPARWTAACGLAMARKSSLEGRLLAVLSEKLNRRGLTRALTAAALLLAAAVAIPLAMLRAADEKTEAKTGAKLQPDTVAKLKWGEPVNGLRMALAWPPVFDDAVLGKKPFFELVVQNVSEKEVHFIAGAEAPNPRKMFLRDGESIVQALSDPEVSVADWKLQSGQCGVLRLFTKEERDKDGTIPSSAIESDLSKIGRYHAIVQMEIAKAPVGAWTGKLVSGQTRGSADVAAAPAPKHKDASPPVAPAPGSVQPITDGRSSAHVLRAVGQEPVVILTGRALTAWPHSTSRWGAVTMEVGTSDKTRTIGYTWPEEAPGFLDLEVDRYPVSRFDLSRGRVFFVHFGKLEFSADVFQVPAAVKVPAINSPETLTRAAAAVTAWHAASDDRALWECSRIVVPERNYKNGQPLDAAAEKIVWGEVNDSGLRIGLGGVEPGASFPVGQRLPVKQYIRNDSTKAITFSPTQIFNEGVGGELVRTADGKKFLHQKGYRWQMFFDRVRLAPGHYIALGSGPMGTTMAEKDGSSPGGKDMMSHGFTVLPGDYTLQLTHDIGQFQGRPVNMNFGDPRGAPGLGEWTGVLKSATVPLRLVDEQAKTARAGDSEAFETRYMIAFDKGVLKLRHYNGFPNMSRTGGPWEDRSRDWKIPAVDGDYVAAWAVGGKGLWVKDASGITHLIVKENLTETGRWTLDQASGGLGGMPAGVRAALQLPPSAAPQTFDFKKLPNAPGAAKISGDFFEMALSPGTVLKVPHGRREFFIENGGSTYGPAEGNPVVELGLTELLRDRLTETPNTAGLDMLRHMIADGRGTIRDCAFRLLADLKTPQAPFDYDAVFHAMIGASIEDEHGPKELTPEAHLGYTWFHNLFHSTRRDDWERTRPLLAAGRYQPGEALGADTAIVWTPGPDGVSLGVSGLPADTNLEIGKSVPVAVYLRNDSTAPVKLSVPSEHNPVIQISLTDAAGKTHRAHYPFSAPLTGYSHHELAPGTGAKVAAFDLEACATPEEANRAEHKEGKAHNPRLAVPAGSYELHLEYRNYQENPVPKGAEWTGKVSAKPVAVKLTRTKHENAPADNTAGEPSRKIDWSRFPWYSGAPDGFLNPFSPDEATRIAKKSEISNQDVQRLEFTILRALAEKAAEFRHLLKDEDLKRSAAKHRNLALAFAAYDFSLYGNKAALDYILDEVAAESRDRAEPAVWTLRWIDEWDLVTKAYDKHFSRIAGSVAEEYDIFWEQREYLYPGRYQQFQAKKLKDAKLDAESLQGAWKGSKDGVSIELRLGEKEDWTVTRGGKQITAALRTEPRGATDKAVFLMTPDGKDGRGAFGTLSRDSDGALRLDTWNGPTEATPYPLITGMVLEKQAGDTAKKTAGSAAAEAQPGNDTAPRNQWARPHFEQWQKYARENGDIPGGLVAMLDASIAGVSDANNPVLQGGDQIVVPRG